MSLTTIILIVVGFGMVTSAFVLAMVFRMIGEKRGEMKQRKEILANGTTATAVIESIRQTNASMDGQPGVIVEVSFVTMAGTTAKAVIDTYVPLIHLASLQEGNEVEIRYVDGETMQAELKEAYIP